MTNIIDYRVFVTYSGKQFNLSDLSKELICLEDISHHLTKICRFGGCLEFNQHYSVAQHSILLSDYALNTLKNKSLAKNILFHDASEAYLGDVVSGVKQFLPDYRDLEKRVVEIIADKYKLKISKQDEKLIKFLDTSILLDEAKLLLPKHYQIFKDQLWDYSPLDVEICNEDPDMSFEIFNKFLDKCEYFGIKD